MTRAVIFLGFLALVLLPMEPLSASYLTLDQGILNSLYQTDENPLADPGTDLLSVTPQSNGTEYWGSLNMGGNGWSQIQIGANYLGRPFGEESASGVKLGDLGLTDLSGYLGYSQSFRNNSKHTWQISLFAKFGFEDQSENGFLLETSWQELSTGAVEILNMNFADVNIWSINHLNDQKTYLGRLNAYSLAINWNHLSAIGFNVGGDVPVDGDGNNFKISAMPIPEPATLVLLGFGLVAMGLAHKHIRRKPSCD